jgi:hypothetical protein
VAATTTEPHSVVPGETLTGFEIYVASKLRAAPFKVTGITTVDCALPKTWTAGLVFPCLRPQERRWPKARSL